VTSSVRDSLHGLDAAGVRWCIRNAPERVDDVPPGGDVDVIVDEHDIAAAARALSAHGFHPFAAPGHSGHHFFLGFLAGRWIKLDVLVDHGLLAGRQSRDGLWVASDQDLARHAMARADGRPALSRRDRIARARPLQLRRMGPIVAVLGPDGAGKGTVIAALAREIPVGVTVARLGTARSGPATVASTSESTPPAGLVRECAFVAQKWLRGWRRLAPAYLAAWRGHVVLCDRHPVEVSAVRPVRGAVAGRLEQWLLTTATPKPDALVILDAPTEVLVARKPEHPAEVIDRWRAGFRSLPGAQVIDTAQPAEASVASTSAVVFDALARRRGW
jgi:thymidylate kinase